MLSTTPCFVMEANVLYTDIYGDIVNRQIKLLNKEI